MAARPSAEAHPAAADPSSAAPRTNGPPIPSHSSSSASTLAQPAAAPADSLNHLIQCAWTWIEKLQRHNEYSANAGDAPSIGAAAHGWEGNASFSHWSSYDSSRALFVAVMHLSCASVHERGAEIRVQWWPCDGWHSEPGALLPTRQYRIRMQQQQQQLPIREDKGADDSAAAASAAEERNHADSSSTTPSSSSRPPRVPTPSNGAAGVIHYMFAQPNAADVHNRVLACWHPAWPVVNDVPGRSRVQLCSYAYSADLLFAQLGRDVRSQELLWVEVRPPPSAGASVRLLCAHIIQPDFVVANTTERGNIITQEQAMQQMEWAWTQSAIKNMRSFLRRLRSQRCLSATILSLESDVVFAGSCVTLQMQVQGCPFIITVRPKDAESNGICYNVGTRCSLSRFRLAQSAAKSPHCDPANPGHDVSPDSPADEPDWRSSLASAESLHLPTKLHADLDNAHEDVMSSPSAPRGLLWALCVSKLLERAAYVSFTSSSLFSPSTAFASFLWKESLQTSLVQLFFTLMSLSILLASRLADERFGRIMTAVGGFVLYSVGHVLCISEDRAVFLIGLSISAIGCGAVALTASFTVLGDQFPVLAIPTGGLEHRPDPQRMSLLTCERDRRGAAPLRPAFALMYEHRRRAYWFVAMYFADNLGALLGAVPIAIVYIDYQRGAAVGLALIVAAGALFYFSVRWYHLRHQRVWFNSVQPMAGVMTLSVLAKAFKNRNAMRQPMDVHVLRHIAIAGGEDNAVLTGIHWTPQSTQSRQQHERQSAFHAVLLCVLNHPPLYASSVDHASLHSLASLLSLVPSTSEREEARQLAISHHSVLTWPDKFFEGEPASAAQWFEFLIERKNRYQYKRAASISGHRGDESFELDSERPEGMVQAQDLDSYENVQTQTRFDEPSATLVFNLVPADSDDCDPAVVVRPRLSLTFVGASKKETVKYYLLAAVQSQSIHLPNQPEHALADSRSPNSQRSQAQSRFASQRGGSPPARFRAQSISSQIAPSSLMDGHESLVQPLLDHDFASGAIATAIPPSPMSIPSPVSRSTLSPSPVSPSSDAQAAYHARSFSCLLRQRRDPSCLSWSQFSTTECPGEFTRALDRCPGAGALPGPVGVVRHMRDAHTPWVANHSEKAAQTNVHIHYRTDMLIYVREMEDDKTHAQQQHHGRSQSDVMDHEVAAPQSQFLSLFPRSSSTSLSRSESFAEHSSDYHQDLAMQLAVKKSSADDAAPEGYFGPSVDSASSSGTLVYPESRTYSAWVLQAWNLFAVHGSVDATSVDAAHKVTKLLFFYVVMLMFFGLLASLQAVLQLQCNAFIASKLSNDHIRLTSPMLSAIVMVVAGPTVVMPLLMLVEWARLWWSCRQEAAEEEEHAAVMTGESAYAAPLPRSAWFCHARTAWSYVHLSIMCPLLRSGAQVRAGSKVWCTQTKLHSAAQEPTSTPNWTVLPPQASLREATHAAQRQVDHDDQELGPVQSDDVAASPVWYDGAPLSDSHLWLYSGSGSDLTVIRVARCRIRVPPSEDHLPLNQRRPAQLRYSLALESHRAHCGVHLTMLDRCLIGVFLLACAFVVCLVARTRYACVNTHAPDKPPNCPVEHDWGQLREWHQLGWFLPQLILAAMSEFMFGPACLEFLFVSSPFSLHSGTMTPMVIFAYLATNDNPVVRPATAHVLLRADSLIGLICSAIGLGLLLLYYQHQIEPFSTSPMLHSRMMSKLNLSIPTLISLLSPLSDLPPAVRRLWRPRAWSTVPRFMSGLWWLLVRGIMVIVGLTLFALLCGFLAAVDSGVQRDAQLDEHEYYYSMLISAWFLLSTVMTIAFIPFSSSRDASKDDLRMHSWSERMANQQRQKDWVTALHHELTVQLHLQPATFRWHALSQIVHSSRFAPVDPTHWTRPEARHRKLRKSPSIQSPLLPVPHSSILSSRSTAPATVRIGSFGVLDLRSLREESFRCAAALFHLHSVKIRGAATLSFIHPTSAASLIQHSLPLPSMVQRSEMAAEAETKSDVPVASSSAVVPDRGWSLTAWLRLMDTNQSGSLLMYTLEEDRSSSRSSRPSVSSALSPSVRRFLQLSYDDGVFVLRTDSNRTFEFNDPARPNQKGQHSKAETDRGGIHVDDPLASVPATPLTGAAATRRSRSGRGSTIDTPFFLDSRGSRSSLPMTPSSFAVAQQSKQRVRVVAGRAAANALIDDLGDDDALLDWTFLSLIVRPTRSGGIAGGEVVITLSLDSVQMEQHTMPYAEASWLFERKQLSQLEATPSSSSSSSHSKSGSVHRKHTSQAMRLYLGKSDQLTMSGGSMHSSSSSSAAIPLGVLLAPLPSLLFDLASIEIVQTALDEIPLTLRVAHRSELLEAHSIFPSLTQQDLIQHETRMMIAEQNGHGSRTEPEQHRTTTGQGGGDRFWGVRPCLAVLAGLQWCCSPAPDIDPAEFAASTSKNHSFRTVWYVRLWRNVTEFARAAQASVYAALALLVYLLSAVVLVPPSRADRVRVYLSPGMRRLLLVWCVAFLGIPLIPCIYRTAQDGMCAESKVATPACPLPPRMCFGGGNTSTAVIVYLNACTAMCMGLLIAEMLIMVAVSYRNLKHRFRLRLVTCVDSFVESQSQSDLRRLRVTMAALRRQVDRHGAQHRRTLLFALLSSIAWLLVMLVLTVVQWQGVSETHLSIWISVLSLTTLITLTTYYLIHQIITLKRIKDEALKPLGRISERRRVQEMERGSRRAEGGMDGAMEGTEWNKAAAVASAAPPAVQSALPPSTLAAASNQAPSVSLSSHAADVGAAAASPAAASSPSSLASVASSVLFDSSVVPTAVLRAQLLEWADSEFFAALDVHVFGLTLSINEAKLWQLFLAAATDIVSTLVMLLRDKIV